ncbi:hypothetical protein FQN49_004558 [Arthroderma sp. PD_2]|nr:hypothetical protein FQN49_004558 [Arthroderma sp. PD_2]
MALPRASQTAGLLTCPVELLQQILKNAADIPSLLAMTQSCHALQAAFQNTQSSILLHVLQNEITPELMHESRVVMDSAHLETKRDKALTLGLITEYFDKRGRRHSQWTIQDALAVSRLHDIVHYFATDFAAIALKRKEDSDRASGKSRITNAISSAELQRFKRAFYRFELYRRLFNPSLKAVDTLFNFGDRYELFWARFSVWEREQVACVLEYLFRSCTPGYNHMVDHNVVWFDLSKQYEFSCTYNNPDILGYLRRGLDYVYEIVHAQTPKELDPLINCPLPEENMFLLNGIVYDANSDRREPLDEYSKEEQLWLVGTPAAFDPDPGPSKAWKWAHLDTSPIFMVQSTDQIPLRKWAYVMWDYDRLLAWDVFYHPFNPYCRKYREDAEAEVESKRRALAQAHAVRSEIFAKGAG